MTQWQPGMLVTAGRLNAATPQPWLPWTPTWSTTSGTGKSTFGGTETIDCSYTQAGKLVVFDFEIDFTAETVFAVGNDNWTFTLPPVPAISSDRAIGFASLYTGSTTQAIAGLAYAFDTASMFVYTNSGDVQNSALSGGVVDAQSPIAWKAGDRLVITGRYEAA